MADPVIVACPVDVWTAVAVNQTSGVIHILSKSPDIYTQTYRDAGESAPADETEAVKVDTPLQISASAGIDVYIMPKGAAGSVRVDL